jgi:hypothetical protein
MTTRFRTLRRSATVTSLVCVLSAVAFAASPTFWTVSSQADFLKGDVEDLSIDSDGRMFLGPAVSVVGETAAPFLWSIVSGPDGTIWVGSGNEGKVLKIGRDGKVSTFFDAAELEVHAIAAAPQGGLYVATSPDGKIYAVGSEGTSKVLFDPDDKYIWALASDAAGTLYAATGDKGAIYKITPDGKGALFYKTSATNVVSLAVTDKGEVIAGTESPGRVFRIDPSGKAFVLLDSPYREIHAIRLGRDGAIYAAALSAASSAGTDRASDVMSLDPSRPAVPSVSAEITSMSMVEGPSASASGPPSSPARSPRRPGRGAIYRIQADGLWDTVWEAADDAPYDLLIEEGGSILVGTGTDGKIFRISGNPARATLLARATARQVTALHRDRSGRILGITSNPGKVFALSSSPARRGTYESDIRDAGTVASWGAIRWRFNGRPGGVELVTRSGNTATPDETWSPWSKVYTTANGDQIASPNARYLQWKATLSSDGGDGPVLTSVTAAYLPRNLRPDVTSITVHPPGAVFQRPFSTGEMEIAGFEENTSDGRQPTGSSSQATGSQPPPPTPTLGRRVYQKGLQTFVWRADDQNDDRLQYDAFYRREGETLWRPIRRGLWDPIFVWDTTSVPDGTYVVKIAASDAPSNSPGTALTGELESASVDIDNTPPHIELQPAAKPGSRTLTFIVRDDHSPVQRVEYSLDGSRWRVVYPKDGIPDSRREEFAVVLEEAESNRSVIIRASDGMNNVATAVNDGRR